VDLELLTQMGAGGLFAIVLLRMIFAFLEKQKGGGGAKEGKSLPVVDECNYSSEAAGRLEDIRDTSRDSKELLKGLREDMARANDSNQRFLSEVTGYLKNVSSDRKD
jgi:hypothetical protein